jgi:predicted RNase H-like HicB family nuclease
MKTKKVEAVIERAPDGGYGIYFPSIPGIGVIGDSEDEAKENLLEVISDIVEQCKSDGVKDRLNGGNLAISYRYDPSAFFKTFTMFNASSLAKAVGINSSLMRQYKTGKIYISEDRKKQIEAGIHKLAHDLLQVRF